MIKVLRSALLSIFIPAALQAATVSGKVTESGSGDPISGAKVVLVSTKGPTDSTTTNAKGAYSFHNVNLGFRTVAAYKSGYQPATSNVAILAADSNYTVDVALSLSIGGGQTGSIAGTVKDDSTHEALINAMVILSHTAGRGTPTAVDTVLTDGEGRFLFAAVPAIANYIVEAKATGYSSDLDFNVDVTANDTVAVPLTLKRLPKPTAAIVGKVTDAGSKAALAGATVVLRKRVLDGSTISWSGLDTALSGSDGSFSFTELAASSDAFPYSLAVTKTDYNKATSSTIVIANGHTDTVNVELAKIALGSMSVFVGLDSTGHRALAGTAVAASLEGQAGVIYTGTTDANGWVKFPVVIAGNYSVTANLAGFLSKEIARSVAADEKDSGYVYLSRATAQNSKSLSGLVRDADGKAVSGAKVIFEGSGSAGLTIYATTTATGDYAFSGIPTGTNSGTLRVQMDGYSDFTAPVTLGAAANFLNVTLQKPASLHRIANGFSGYRLVRNGREVFLEIASASLPGRVSLFDARGVRTFTRSIPAGSLRLSLPTLGGSSYLVVERGGQVESLSVPKGN